MTQTAVSAAISSTNEDRRSRVVRIAILGTPLGNRNRGVMALASSLVKLLAEASDRTEFTFLDVHAPLPDTYFHCGERKVRATVTTCRMSLKGGISNHLFWIFFLSLLYRILPVESIRRSLARSSPWIAAIRNADIVGDVRGGDSFSDIYGLARFLTGSVCSASVLLVKGSLIHFPQTYGPFKSRAGKSVARALLKRSGVVIARDKRSYEAAEEIIGSSQNLRLSPDVAFAMDAVRPERLEFDKSGFDIGAGGIIGINFNALMFNGGYGGKDMFGLKLDYRQFVHALVSALLAHTEAKILLIPHVFAPIGDVESDLQICHIVRDQLSADHAKRVTVLEGTYDQHEVKWVIGRCDFVIGSRMHACIAALSQHVPCIGVAYSMKFEGVFESVGATDCVIDGRTISSDDAVQRIISAYNRREQIGSALKTSVATAKAQLRTVFSEVMRNI